MVKKWSPVRRNPLRQNRRNNSHHDYPHPRRVLCRSINGSGMTFLLLNTLVRNPYPSVSRMTRMQRHRGLHREIDGAVEWNRWLLTFCRCHSDAPRWTNQMWIDHLHGGSNKKIFQCCLNSDSFTLSMRAIQGHSGGNNVDFLLLVDVQIPYTWNKYIYHVGSSLDLHSTLSNQDGLQEERIRKKKDKRYSSQP